MIKYLIICDIDKLGLKIYLYKMLPSKLAKNYCWKKLFHLIHLVKNNFFSAISPSIHRQGFILGYIHGRFWSSHNAGFLLQVTPKAGFFFQVKLRQVFISRT